MFALRIFITISALLNSLMSFAIEKNQVLQSKSTLEMLQGKSSGFFQIQEDPNIFFLKKPFVLAAGRVANHEGFIISDLSRWQVRESFCKELSNIKDFRPKSFDRSSVKKINSSAILVDSLGSQNYFHWMVQIIPRFFAARKLGLKAKFYVFPKIINDFQKQTMDLLCLKKSTAVNFSEATLQFDELYVPEVSFLPAQGKRILPRWVRVEWFKTLRIEEPKKIGTRRIYISRERSQTRQVLNEEELLEVLEPLGFKKYFLEDLDLKQQAELFSQSEIIVSPHGAGLANLIFAAPGSTVIELFDRQHVNRTYELISKSLGLSYHGFVSQELEEEESFPVFAPIDSLKSLLMKVAY